MRKYTVAILMISVLLSLLACGNEAKPSKKDATDDVLPNDTVNKKFASDDDGVTAMELVYTEVASLEKEEHKKIVQDLLVIGKSMAREFYIPYVSLVKTPEELKNVTSEKVEKYDADFFENHALLEVTYFSYGSSTLEVEVDALTQVDFGDRYNVQLKLFQPDVETPAMPVVILRTFLIEIDTYQYSNVTVSNVTVDAVWG